MFNFVRIAGPKEQEGSQPISPGDLALADQLSAISHNRDGRLQHRAVRSALHEMNRVVKDSRAGRALLAHYALGTSRAILGGSWFMDGEVRCVGFGSKGFEIIPSDCSLRVSDWPDLLSIESPKERRRALVEWSRRCLPLLLEFKLAQLRDAQDGLLSSEGSGARRITSPNKLDEATKKLAALHRRFDREVRLALPGMNRNMRSSRVGQAVMEWARCHRQIARFGYRWSLGGKHFGLAFTGRRGFVIQRIRPDGRWPIQDFKDYARREQHDIEQWAARWLVARAASLLASARPNGDPVSRIRQDPFADH